MQVCTGKSETGVKCQVEIVDCQTVPGVVIVAVGDVGAVGAVAGIQDLVNADLAHHRQLHRSQPGR